MRNEQQFHCASVQKQNRGGDFEIPQTTFPTWNRGWNSPLTRVSISRILRQEIQYRIKPISGLGKNPTVQKRGLPIPGQPSPDSETKSQVLKRGTLSWRSSSCAGEPDGVTIPEVGLSVGAG